MFDYLTNWLSTERIDNDDLNTECKPFTSNLNVLLNVH